MILENNFLTCYALKKLIYNNFFGYYLNIFINKSHINWVSV